MADVKISALGAIGSVAGEDLVAIVDDPSGTPASRKATIDQIKTYIDAMTASSTATLTNKTFDVEGTGNSISNIDVADLKSGVLDTDITSVSASDDTIPSAKAVKTYVDAQIATEDTLAELNDTTITSVGDNEILQYNNSSSVWENQTLAEAGISPVAGSSSIVTVGTIATGTWQGTAIADGYLGTGINATKIADGSVTSTEFQYINTLSSNAQTQLDSKAPIASPTFTGTVTTATLDVAGNNIDNIQNLIHDTSASGTDIDFSEDQLQTISISANTTFTTANRAIGKSKTIKITTDGTERNLTFPSWKFVGAKPTSQAASKIGILTCTCFGTADTDIVAAYAVEA